MAASALSVVALIVAGAQGEDGTVVTGTGPAETVEVEVGTFYVKPDRVEIAPGTRLVLTVTNGGDMAHDLRLDGKTGMERLQPPLALCARLRWVGAHWLRVVR